MHFKFNDYRPKQYFLHTFTVTFVLWAIGAYFSFQKDNGFYMIIMLLGLITPFIISIWMIYHAKNPVLKKDFINRIINFKLINIKLLPLLFLIMPFTILLSIAISLLLGESTAQFQLSSEFSFSSGFVPVILLLLMAATFEELGWRGYAFDSLQERYNYFHATLVFSILWSLWHFPLIFVNNSYQYEIFNENIWYGVNFFVSIIPMGIIISWICIKNGKSIFAAILFHFMINLAQEVLAITQFTKCIETFVLIFIAIAIIIWDKELFFSTNHLKERNCE